MALHFSSKEFADRRSRAIDLMLDRGLDGLLMFRQESMYYLTGYDSFGYVFFQCLYLGADGRLMLLTRAPDLRQARHTSLIEDIRIWVDGPAVDPAGELKAVLAGFGCRGKRLGVEYDAYGLTARNGKMLEAALDDFCTLIDASDLISRLRVVKSPAPMKAKSWRPCKGRYLPAEVITRPTSLLSAREKTPCCAVTRPAGANWIPMTS